MLVLKQIIHRWECWFVCRTVHNLAERYVYQLVAKRSSLFTWATVSPKILVRQWGKSVLYSRLYKGIYVRVHAPSARLRNSRPCERAKQTSTVANWHCRDYWVLTERILTRTRKAARGERSVLVIPLPKLWNKALLNLHTCKSITTWLSLSFMILTCAKMYLFLKLYVYYWLVVCCTQQAYSVVLYTFRRWYVWVQYVCAVYIASYVPGRYVHVYLNLGLLYTYS